MYLASCVYYQDICDDPDFRGSPVHKFTPKAQRWVSNYVRVRSVLKCFNLNSGKMLHPANKGV